jgi:hypothetical protein
LLIPVWVKSEFQRGLPFFWFWFLRFGRIWLENFFDSEFSCFHHRKGGEGKMDLLLIYRMTASRSRANVILERAFN